MCVNKSLIGGLRVVHVKSNVNVVIRVVSNFFFNKIFYMHKKHKKHKKHKTHIKRAKTKKVAFLCAEKISKGKKVAYSLICTFVLFMCFLCLQNIYAKRFKTALMTSFTWLLQFFFPFFLIDCSWYEVLPNQAIKYTSCNIRKWWVVHFK